MRLLTAIAILLITIPVFSQEKPKVTQEDYDRAKAFSSQGMREKIYNIFVRPQWLEDGSGFWYSSNTPKGKVYWKLDWNEFTREEAFDHEKMAELLKDSLNLTSKAENLSLQNLEFLDEGFIGFNIGRRKYKAHLENQTLEELEGTTPSSPLESTSPDGKWIAYSKDYNLFIRPAKGGDEIQLSKDGKKGYEYASSYRWDDIIEGENGQRPERFSVTWSPDSKKILANIVDLREASKMYLLDWSVDTLFRPRLLSYYRGSPADTNIIYEIPVIFDVETKKEIPIDLPKAAHFNPIYFEWLNDGENLLTIYWERGYKTMHIGTIDPATGKASIKFTETSKTNVDNRFFTYRYTEDGKTLIFTSEKSGWNHLYNLNLENGELTQLTDGDFFVNRMIDVDEEKGCIYFQANGKNPRRNPYHSYFYRVDIDGGKMKLLTPEEGNHWIEISPNKQYVVDNYSQVDVPTVTILRNLENGKTVMDISKADVSKLKKTGWDFPQIFTATARDGKTTIYGALFKPSNFDPSKSYPIIDYSYTGPHTYTHPIGFTFSTNGPSQQLAELGFIVMKVDGLGSAMRSKEFHDWSYKQMGENLTDHVLAIRQLGEKFSWIDTTRVGIMGHSAGGYDAAHALLRFPDFYKVAVASSADHDHRMEKAWWPEMYMGWPVDSAYHLQSNISMAGNLKGKLLITHGGKDENVNPSATFKLAEALISADKDFDMLIFPSQRHGYRGKYWDYFSKKRWNYFVEHLMGAEPIW